MTCVQQNYFMNPSAKLSCKDSVEVFLSVNNRFDQNILHFKCKIVNLIRKHISQGNNKLLFHGQNKAEKVKKNFFNNSNEDFTKWRKVKPTYCDIEKNDKILSTNLRAVKDSVAIPYPYSQNITRHISLRSLAYLWHHNKNLTTVIGLIVFFSSIYFGVFSFCAGHSLDSFISFRLVDSKITIF